MGRKAHAGVTHGPVVATAGGYRSVVRMLIIGATGDIGMAVVAAALEAAHEVTVVVRSPEKLGALRDRVRVVQGDLADPGILEDAVSGQDAVISAMGSSPNATEIDVPATIMRAVIEAMGGAGVRRLVGLAGGAVDVPGERKPLSSRLTTWSRPSSGSSPSSTPAISTGRWCDRPASSMEHQPVGSRSAQRFTASA